MSGLLSLPVIHTTGECNMTTGLMFLNAWWHILHSENQNLVTKADKQALTDNNWTVLQHSRHRHVFGSSCWFNSSRLLMRHLCQYSLVIIASIGSAAVCPTCRLLAVSADSYDSDSMTRVFLTQLCNKWQITRDGRKVRVLAVFVTQNTAKEEGKKLIAAPTVQHFPSDKQQKQSDVKSLLLQDRNLLRGPFAPSLVGLWIG